MSSLILKRSTSCYRKIRRIARLRWSCTISVLKWMNHIVQTTVLWSGKVIISFIKLNLTILGPGLVIFAVYKSELSVKRLVSTDFSEYALFRRQYWCHIVIFIFGAIAKYTTKRSFHFLVLKSYEVSLYIPGIICNRFLNLKIFQSCA